MWIKAHTRLAVVATVVLAPVGLADAGERLIIAQPGYPGSTKDAERFVERLGKAIADRGGPTISAGEYHNDAAEALAAIREKKPTLGIVSLGFFLEHRKTLALEPLLWTRPEETYRVVVRKGSFASLDALNGKTVTGTPLSEAEFIARVVFDGAEKSGPKHWKSDAAKYFSKAVRDVVKARKDAVLLSEREYEGMKRLRSASKLEVVHETAAFPAAVVVAFGAPATPAAAATKKSFASALTALAPRKDDAEASGEDVLETMGIDGFAKVERARLERFAASYDRGRSK